jgi:hypothetical protein
MAAYLLRLSTLHLAAPGVLDVIFGPDGDFDGAPDWIGHVWAWSPAWGPESRAACFRPVTCVYPETISHGTGGGITRFEHAALDLRMPSTYARLTRLCSMVQDIDADITPEALAALTLDLAPKIAALKTST